MLELAEQIAPYLFAFYFAGRVLSEQGWKKADEVVLLTIALCCLWLRVSPEFGPRLTRSDVFFDDGER